MMHEDVELLRRYSEWASQEAFSELVQRRIGLVYSIAFRKTHDAHHAKDVTQKVFIDLAKKATHLQHREALIGWLYRTTHYTAIDLVRSEQSRTVREKKAQVMHETLANDAPALDWERIRPLLDEIISNLDERDRDAILLRFFDERSFSEIGQRLHLTENAARMRVTRALERLRDLLEKRGLKSTTTLLAGALGAQGAIAPPAGLAATIATYAIAVSCSSATLTGIFMSTPFIVASAIAVVSLGTSAYEVGRVKRTEANLSSLTQEREELRGQMAEIQLRASQSELRVVALQRELDSAHSAKKAPPSAANKLSPGPGTTAINEEERATLSRVAQEVARRRTLRVQTLDTTYRALYQRLGFMPDDIELFKRLMTDNAKKSEEVLKSALAQSADVNTAVRETNLQAAAELQEKLRGAFGDAAFEAFQHFNETLPAREITNQLVANLFYTESPLTTQQAERLVEIVAANLPNALTKSDPTKSRQPDLEKIVQEAQPLLTESQTSIFRQLVAQQFANPAVTNR